MTSHSYNGDDPVLLEISMEPGITSNIFGVYDEHNDVLLPVCDMLQFAGMSCEHTGIKRLLLDLKNSSLFDVDDSEIRDHSSGKSWPIRWIAISVASRSDSNTESDSSPSPYIKSQHLEEILGVLIFVDKERSSAKIENSEQLPAVIKARNVIESQNRLQKLNDSSQDSIHSSHFLTPPTLRKGIALQYSALIAGSNTFRSSYSFSLAATAAGGVIGSDVYISESMSTLESLFWERSRRSVSEMSTTFRAGSFRLEMTRATNIYGISLKRRYHDNLLPQMTRTISGSTERGWMVEVLREGRILGYTESTDGRYNLSIPAGGGSAMYDIIHTGPLGDQRILSRMMLTPQSPLPKGATEFSFAVGICSNKRLELFDNRCKAAADGDIRIGLSSTWWLRTGFETELSEKDSKIQTWPFITLSGSPHSSVLLSITAGSTESSSTPRVTEAGLKIHPTSALELSLDYSSGAVVISDIGEGMMNGHQEILYSHEPNSRFYGSAKWSFGRPGRRLSFDISTLSATSKSRNISEKRAGIAYDLGIIKVKTYAGNFNRSQSLQMKDVNSIGAEFTFVPPSNKAAWWIWSAIEKSRSTESGFSSLVIARNIFESRIHAGVRRYNASGRMEMNIGISPRLDWISAHSSTAITSRNGYTVGTQSLNASGSAMIDLESGNIELSSIRSINSGGIAGKVFLDLNNDGTRSDNEPVIAGIRIITDNISTHSNTKGEWSVWGLTPRYITNVSVDQQSIPVPWWVPSVEDNRVRILPGLRTTVDIPLAMGGIVEGNVMFDGSDISMPGSSRLIFTHIESGKRTTINTFEDGSFLSIGIRSGKHLIEAHLPSHLAKEWAVTDQEIDIVSQCKVDKDLLCAPETTNISLLAKKKTDVIVANGIRN